MANVQLQIDEIEALAAIFGEDWIIQNEESRIFSITLKNDCVDEDATKEELLKEITIEFRFPEDYPLNSPPLYTLSAPWMSRKEKIMLMNDLEEIYGDHAGESIVYMW